MEDDAGGVDHPPQTGSQAAGETARHPPGQLGDPRLRCRQGLGRGELPAQRLDLPLRLDLHGVPSV